MRISDWIALVAWLAADQLSKLWVLSQASLPLAVTPFFNVVLSHNPGAAFGMFSEGSGWQNLFFVAVAVIISAVILWYLFRMPREERQVRVALVMILAGALGNLVDRLRFGAVVDFVDLHAAAWHWFTFNVADIAISVGAALLVADAFGWRLLRARRT
ncbi:MAG: signal peptidase II [Gammaproteobacteria bacterium]|jgi:signal peptidase II|nr:signal peptidase II [Gammaproteobacteria bacterium]